MPLNEKDVFTARIEALRAVTQLQAADTLTQETLGYLLDLAAAFEYWLLRDEPDEPKAQS